MNKFDYGNYDSTQSATVFTSEKNYGESDGEATTRKQLSYPLKEIKDYINDTLPFKEVSDEDKTVVLKLTDDNLIQYSLDGETFYDTATGGHIIYDEDETQLAQKTKLMFKNTSVYNSGNYTVVEGLQGEQGVSVSSMVQVEQSSSSGGNNKWRATLSNGTTYDFIVKNGLQGEKGDDGEQGNGLNILGTYATLEALQTAHPTGDEGDIYSVGNGVSNTCYVWDTDDNGWESIGKVQGEKGAKGDTGEQGATGNGIQSIVVTESSVSGGNNLVTITMTSGQVYTFNVKNGAQGQAGQGVPTGGTVNQVLAKNTSLDYDLKWMSLPTVDQTYDSTSTNAQSGTAVAGGISAYDNYSTLSIPITGWTSSTLESETVYTYTATLSGATSGKHPLVSLSPTKPSTMDDENEMFGQIIKVEEGANTLTITSSAIPTTAYTLQVKNY